MVLDVVEVVVAVVVRQEDGRERWLRAENNNDAACSHKSAGYMSERCGHPSAISSLLQPRGTRGSFEHLHPASRGTPEGLPGFPHHLPPPGPSSPPLGRTRRESTS